MAHLKTDELNSLIYECQFSEQARALAEEESWHSSDFFHALEAKKLKRDGIDFFAHYLASPTAIRWAYECLTGLDKVLASEENKALENIQLWLNDPTDATRRLHSDPLEEIGVESPVAWVSQAIFWSGGSLTPPKAAVVEAQSFMCGHALSGGLLLAVYGDDALYQEERFDSFISLGKQWLKQ